MDLYEAVKKRFSVRKYKSDPIDDQVLDRVLDAARLAPSWANVQATRYIIVTDQDIKAELATCLTKGNPSTNAITQAPVIIGLCFVKGTSGYYTDQPLTSLEGQWGMFDAGLAAANLTLAAAAEGLGTVHVGALNIEKAAQILEVPEQAQFVELIPLGYPDQEFYSPKRMELAELLFKERYGKKG